MIYKELTAYDLKREFEKWDRDYFSFEACEKMIEIFEDTQFELDIIALCCDFTEYTPDELMSDFEYLLTMPIEDTMIEYKDRFFETYIFQTPTQEEEEEAEYYSKMKTIHHILNQLEGDYTAEKLTNGNYLIF